MGTKLIEVALPLDAINAASVREKSIRHGHPSTLHLWWARRPLAAARAVLFSSIVEDPSSPDYPWNAYEWPARWRGKEKSIPDDGGHSIPEDAPTETQRQDQERDRLHAFLADLVRWESSTDEEILGFAREIIRAHTGGNPPPVLDPFAGGGSIPLEAQRLGLKAYASDLNPVAVLINKALIEIPPTFAGQPPINPEMRSEERARSHALPGADRLAEGAGGHQGNGSVGAVAAARGDRQEAVADHERGRLGPSGYGAGIAGGDGHVLDGVRGDRSASGGHSAASGTSGRGWPDADADPSEYARAISTPASLRLFPQTWKGATGLAADVRYYGKWMRDEAEKRIGHLYPKVKLPPEQGGGEATVIAWLWARTVTCPNPACQAQMPLVSSFWLSKKRGKEAWLEPEVVPNSKHVRFVVHYGKGEPQDDTINRRGGRCVVCGTSVPFTHIRKEGQAGHMGQQLMAIVAEGKGGRQYVEASEEHARIAELAEPTWRPDVQLPNNPRDFKTPNYGLRTFGDLFTDRQLVALTTFSDLVGEARERAYADAVAAGLPDDGIGLADGGAGARAYADAIATYLAFVIDKGANLWSTLCGWMSDRGALRETFARQALPMVWDYAEANPFSDAGGSVSLFVDRISDAIEHVPASNRGVARQADARKPVPLDARYLVISTDPPYYDNIGYADLSDFFYVWLRRSLRAVYGDLFSTLLTPKDDELIASPYRHGGDKEKAKKFFEEGLTRAFSAIHSAHSPELPMTVFYAFKQNESVSNGDTSQRASTGWDTMLEALFRVGFSIDGTWPLRTEGAGRLLARDANALASSIVLSCRVRPEDAPVATRAEFTRALRRELPEALRKLRASTIAPVDLAQAAIGPGMMVYSRYSGVLEADGKKMRVRTALQLINQVLDEVLAEQDSDYDAHTGWAIAWFEQFGTNEGAYGLAETLATARNVSISALVEAGIVSSGRGKVRLLRRDELPTVWDPTKDRRLTDWEIAQHLIRTLEGHGWEGAAKLKRQIGDRAELAKDLAYRLYTVAERKGWAQEALSYNGLVVAWPEITRIASELTPAEEQAPLEM